VQRGDAADGNVNGNAGHPSAGRRPRQPAAPSKGVARAKPSSGGIDQIGASLRHAYESTLEEPVPDSILDLLRQLD